MARKNYEPPENPKSFQQLLEEGIPHKGGLSQLASAEQAALSRHIAAGLFPSDSNTSKRKH